MVTTTTSFLLLVFIVSPSFLSISADALHMFSLRFETLLITRFGLWALLNLFEFQNFQISPFLLFAITQDLFMPIFF